MSSERREWSKRRNWRDGGHTQAVAESKEIEGLMRSILKLFADGCLVYRDRTQRAHSVETKSDRLRWIRGGLVALPGERIDGPAAVA